MTMTPDRAAFVIQSAWRRFDDDRQSQAYEAYEAHIADLNATYYHQCYEPVDNDNDDCYYDYNTETWVKW
jgi:hypothetical protein